MQQTSEGLVPGSPGWFVINAREARWRRRPERGYSLPLSGWSDEECETHFPQLGVNLIVLAPGEPLLIIEGEERPLRQWDYVHCPPKANHIIVGAGSERSVILAMSSREFIGSHDWGGYPAGPVAQRHDAAVEEDTTDPRRVRTLRGLCARALRRRLAAVSFRNR